MEQGNTYTLTLEPKDSTILAKSKVPILSLGFVFNAVHLGGEIDDSFQPLSPEVRVLVNGSVFKAYSYDASATGETSVPLGVIIYGGEK